MGETTDIIKRCINLDEWQHSWHNNLRGVKNLKKARDVIKDKIRSRLDELSLLSKGLDDVDKRIDWAKEGHLFELGYEEPFTVETDGKTYSVEDQRGKACGFGLSKEMAEDFCEQVNENGFIEM